MESRMENPGYDQLHTNPTRSLFLSGLVGAESLLCQGRGAGIPLDGAWHASPDIYDNGVRAAWYRESGGEFDHSAPKDYDFEAWDTVEIPCCWNCVHPRYELYEGSFWFFRTFGAPELPPGWRAIIEFGAVNYAAMVFVNGELVASHEGGFTPFCADVTDRLLPPGEGQNRLLVWVSNARREDAVPADFTDWFNYGGIYRSVGLYLVPACRIADWTLRLSGPEACDISLELALNAARPLAGHVEIDGLLSADFHTDELGKFSGTFSCRPELWSPQNPRLYTVSISAGEDSVQDEIGFRWIEARGSRLYLNGSPLFLRGITAHEESETRGRALSLEEMRSTLGLARDLGCNFMRLAHYPHSGEMAKLADRMGMLLWEEIPVYWSLDFANPATLANASNQLAELMKRDANRASVIVWAVGNENPDTDERFSFMQSLIRTVKDRNDGRLVSAACLVDLEHFVVSDRLASVVDILGINEYFGWYYYGYEKLARLLDHEWDRPVVVSEFGAEATSGLHGNKNEQWTEEYQEEVYRNQFATILGSGRVAGLAPWLLYDFKTPRRLNPRQKMYNLKGLADRSKTYRKLAFDFVRSEYRRIADY